MASNDDLIRRLLESIKKQSEKDAEKGINKPRSTIRHMEASADGTNARLLTSLPAHSHEVE